MDDMGTREVSGAMSRDTDVWEPGHWWRVVASDGSIWAETSDEQEARERVREGDTLMRWYLRTETKWEVVPDD